MSRIHITCAVHPDLDIHLSSIAVAEIVELRVPRTRSVEIAQVPARAHRSLISTFKFYRTLRTPDSLCITKSHYHKSSASVDRNTTWPPHPIPVLQHRVDLA
jgi:hypothetical protein